MTISISGAENLANQWWSKSSVEDGVIYGDGWTYNDGTTAEALRSGVDGPHTRLADRLCGLNGRLYE